MSFTPSQDLLDAMLVGGIDGILDAHPTINAYAIVYSASDTALVTIDFARPAATLVAHQLLFAQNEAGGDQIFAQGNGAYFKLFNGGGTYLGQGDVSDLAGTGAMKISGTTGTLLYAGARAILGTFAFA